MEHTRVSHYQIGRLLGRGGMGEVFEAEDLDLKRRVALKFLAPSLASDAESTRRFEREALAAAALNHPHIATIYAFEREGRRPFIAMELVTGERLRDRIQRGPLPLADALGVAREVAAALALAHERGIVHRDIKPENLMFDEHGAIKVMDFGLAHASHSSRITTTGTTIGTAAYMAPESIHGRVEAPADVFALGLVLHEMLAGQPAFAGESPLALLYGIANQEPRDLRAARPEVPEAVASLVRRMLEKDPNTRIEARAVVREIDALLGRDSAPLTVGPPAHPQAPSIDTRAPTTRIGRGRRWVREAAIAFAVLGLAVWLALSRRQATVDPQAVLLNNRGLEALDRGRYDEAADLFRAAIARDPGLGPAALNLGMLHRLRGQDAVAESIFTAVLARFPNEASLRARALRELAELDMRAGTWESAETNLAASFALDSSTAAAYNQLGYALIMVKRPQEARAVLARGITRFPSEAFLHKNAGLAALQMGDDAGALAALDRALQLSPDWPEARALRARALDRGGRAPEAREAWRSYWASHPDSATRALVEREVGPVPPAP